MKAIFLLAVIVSTMALDLPSNFKTCKKSDPKITDCLKIAVRDAIISMANGLKSFKILPIEPLAVDSLKIGESKDAVSLKQEYRNIKIHGLTKGLQVYDFQMDRNNLTLKAETFQPRVDFIADYKLYGKILLLPIQGEGKSNISMHGLVTKHEIYYENIQKDGDTYIRALKYIVKFKPKHATIHLDNLFNGDSILGEQIQRLLNENSDLIFKELQVPYEETFGLIFTKIANDIFTHVPMNKIFM